MKPFIFKVWQKALQFSRIIIYYNYSFKPSGLSTSSKDFAQKGGEKEGVVYTEIYPSETSQLDVPESMYMKFSPYPKHGYKVDVPAAFILEIENGRIYQEGLNSFAVINANSIVMGDVSFQYSRSKWMMVPPKDNVIFKLKYFVKPLELKGTAFSLLAGGGVSIGNYFHWVLDALARIQLLKKANLFDSVDWFLVHNLRADFVMDSLELLGIKKSQVVEVDSIKHVKADKLIVSSAVRGNDKHLPLWAIDFFRESFLSKIQKKYDYHHLYISRNDASARHVLNEKDLIQLLEKYGFKVVMLSEYSFEEKIDLFSSADVIVSPIGAQLTNLVFCKKGSALIELFPKGFVLPDSVDIAKKVGMNYYYQICENETPSKNIADGRKEHLTVDIQKIKATLDQVISVSSL